MTEERIADIQMRRARAEAGRRGGLATAARSAQEEPAMGPVTKEWLASLRALAEIKRPKRDGMLLTIMLDEIDRLRAENTRLRDALDVVKQGANNWVYDVAKETLAADGA